MFPISVLCLLKLLNAILVSFRCNRPIIVNHVGRFLCTDDVPQLQINFYLCQELYFLHYKNYSLAVASHRCIKY